MIKSPLKGSSLKLNVYVAPIGGIHLAESCTLDTKLYKIVTELPAVGEEHKIYLIESSVQGEQNIYTEYGYINGAWEELGQYRAKIDLEPYALKTEMSTKTSQLVNDSNL